MKQENYAKLSIAVIVIAAAIRFALVLTHTVAGDACWHLASARFIATENKLPLYEGLGRLQPFWPPPAFHFVAALFYKVFGIINSDTANISIKFVSPIFGTLTIIISYLIARKLFDEKIAFYSTIFLNFVPLFIDYTVFSYTDSTTAFFSILSIHLMLNKRYALSSISFGVALLSKYNAVFMLPMLLYLSYRFSGKRERCANMLVTALLPLLISSLWFLRNLILLGNPFWPYLNGIFRGVNIGLSFNAISFSSLFSIENYLRSYLELFGVPNGNIPLIFFYDIPYMKYLLFIWAVSTLIFIYPFIIGFLSNRIEGKKNAYFLKGIYILFLSHLLMLFVYLVNTGWFGARLLLPIVPFMAIVWAKGLNSVKIKKIYIIMIFLISAGFVATEITKVSIAAKEWGIYKQDFESAKDNSNGKDVFYGNGQCLSYNINRLVVDHTAQLNFKEIDYVWANDKWKIDFPMNGESFNKVKSSDRVVVVYNNPNTGTIIYKVKQ